MENQKGFPGRKQGPACESGAVGSITQVMPVTVQATEGIQAKSLKVMRFPVSRQGELPASPCPSLPPSLPQVHSSPPSPGLQADRRSSHPDLFKRLPISSEPCPTSVPAPKCLPTPRDPGLPSLSSNKACLWGGDLAAPLAPRLAELGPNFPVPAGAWREVKPHRLGSTGWRAGARRGQ